MWISLNAARKLNFIRPRSKYSTYKTILKQSERLFTSRNIYRQVHPNRSLLRETSQTLQVSISTTMTVQLEKAWIRRVCWGSTAQVCKFTPTKTTRLKECGTNMELHRKGFKHLVPPARGGGLMIRAYPHGVVAVQSLSRPRAPLRPKSSGDECEAVRPPAGLGFSHTLLLSGLWFSFC